MQQEKFACSTAADFLTLSYYGSERIFNNNSRILPSKINKHTPNFQISLIQCLIMDLFTFYFCFLFWIFVYRCYTLTLEQKWRKNIIVK